MATDGSLLGAAGKWRACVWKDGAARAWQCAVSFHCLVEERKDCEELKSQPKEEWNFVDQTREETKHRTKWCAGTSRYRCMRCVRSSKHMKMKGNCTGPPYLAKDFGKMV